MRATAPAKRFLTVLFPNGSGVCLHDSIAIAHGVAKKIKEANAGSTVYIAKIIGEAVEINHTDIVEFAE